MNLPLTIDTDSHLPIYLQISRALKERILSGILPEGTKLPSTQSLADSLDIARATVVKAYADLTSQGYAEAVSGGGTFVSKRAIACQQISNPEKTGAAHLIELSSYARQLETVGTGGGSSVENIKLNYGAPALDMIPAAAWKQVLMEDCRRMEMQDSDWMPEPFGLYRCRAAIAEFLCRSKGLKCSPEQIMLFSGCKESFTLTTKLLLDKGDLAALENPSYEDPRTHLRLSGIEILPVDTDDNGMIVSQLTEQARAPKFVYVSPSQDPTGALMSLARRQQLLGWTEQNNAFIWEEGWDSDYNYSPPQLPSLQSMDNSGRVLYSYCFWKLLYPLVTIGVLVLPPQLLGVFERSRQIADIQFSMLEQKSLATFIQEGMLDRHLKKSKRIYEQRRKALIDCLLQHLRGAMEIPRQSAGLHLCLRFLLAKNADEILHLAEQARLPLVSTNAYYMQNQRANEFLLPFALLAEDAMRERVQHFARLLLPVISS